MRGSMYWHIQYVIVSFTGTYIADVNNKQKCVDVA